MSKNLVLIGMPGSGKTTIGKLISQKLNYDFVDMDEFMQHKHGKTINEMFLKGEEYFREEESKCCNDVASMSSCVISTGGGVIKNYTNVKALASTGIIVFIDRKVEDILSDIKISSRPLLKDGKEKLYKLYEERHALYKQYAHIIINNNKSIETVVEDIKIKFLNKKASM